MLLMTLFQVLPAIATAMECISVVRMTVGKEKELDEVCSLFIFFAYLYNKITDVSFV